VADPSKEAPLAFTTGEKREDRPRTPKKGDFPPCRGKPLAYRGKMVPCLSREVIKSFDTQEHAARFGGGGKDSV